MNGYTFRGSHSGMFIFTSQLLKEIICSCSSKFFPFGEGGSAVIRSKQEATEVFVYAKMKEKHGGVSICLKLFLCSHSHNEVTSDPQRNGSMAAVRGAMLPSMIYLTGRDGTI